MRRIGAHTGFGLAVVGLAALGMPAQAVVYHYEMLVRPDAEAHKMTEDPYGFGFGDPLKVPPYGLQGDGTARFVDDSFWSGGGFWVTGLASGGTGFTVDMRVKVNRSAGEAPVAETAANVYAVADCGTSFTRAPSRRSLQRTGEVAWAC